MTDNKPLPDTYLAQILREHIDRNLSNIFCRIENAAPENRARLLAHMEDRVQEEVAKLIGEEDGRVGVED